jgi:manganese/zinc/iron transport system substrate-binding protein
MDYLAIFPGTTLIRRLRLSDSAPIDLPVQLPTIQYFKTSSQRFPDIASGGASTEPILTSAPRALKILISQKLARSGPDPSRNPNHPRMLRKRLIHCSFLLISVAFAGCSRDMAAENRASSDAPQRQFTGQYPIRVVCTTGMVTDILRNVGGEHLNVTGLMGPGVDPHLYKAVPADIEKLSSADAIFYNGLHLEGRMADLFEDLAKRKPTYAVTHSLVEAKDKRLRTPPEFEGYYDPHVWHAPQMWAECVKYVADELAKYDPTHRDDYVRNRDAYLKQVADADTYCREQLALIKPDQRVLVTAHDAFGYFCIAYGLKSMPLKGVSTEDEVTIGRMDEVIAFLVDHKIKAVFVESATAPQIVKNLIEPCRKAGHEVKIGGELYADALGPAKTGADTYLGMIKANIDTIVSALK